MQKRALKPNGVSEGQWLGFCRDAHAGVSVGTLALVYGRPERTIYNWLKRLGLKGEAPGFPEATNTERNPVSSTELTSKEEE